MEKLYFVIDDPSNNKHPLAKAHYLGNKSNSAHSNEMLVLKGSKMIKTHTLSKTQCLKKRKTILDKTESMDDYLVLTEDVTFSSPSLAAAVLLGKEGNGLIRWCTEQGHTLKEWLQSECNKPNEAIRVKDKANDSENNTGRIDKIKRILKVPHKHWFEKDFNEMHYSDVKEANDLVLDLENTPEAFFIGCLMDRRIKAERAWTIPWIIKQHFSTLDIKSLGQYSLWIWQKFFNEKNLHRTNNVMAELLYLAIKKVNTEYDGDVRNIWNDTADAKIIVDRFMAFKGIGVKIATMAVNILYRDYNLPLDDLSGLDISPDVQVLKVFYRLGLIDDRSNIDSVIQKARELNPEFPGIFDLGAWEIGRRYCHEKTPDCKQCPLNLVCRRNGVNHHQNSDQYGWSR